MRLSLIAASIVVAIAFTAPARAGGWIDWANLQWCQYYDAGWTTQTLSGQPGPPGYRRRNIILECEYLFGFGVY